MDLFIEKSIQPMLISAEGNPFDDAGYVYELKLDGERCIAYLASPPLISCTIRTKP